MFQRRERECVRLAGLTKDEVLRDQLLNMAREWMATAMHETKVPHAKSLIDNRP
jgi:hypothetical protein